MHRTRIFPVAFLLFAACNNPPGGLGLGRPDFTAPVPAALTAVAITQVYAPTGDANGFVQLENQSGAVIDFADPNVRLTLVSDSGTMDVGQAAVKGGDSSQQWAAGARRAVAITDALQVHASSGSLAVVSQSGIIQGSASWGLPSGPNAPSSDFESISAAGGAPTATASAGLPFPLPQGAAINLDPNVQDAPCVTANADAVPATPASCPQLAGVIALTRVAPSSLDPNGGYVEVRNLTGAALDVYGLQVCTPTCQPVRYASSDPNFPPGYLAANGTGTPDASRGVIGTGHTVADEKGFVSADITPPAPQGEVFLLRPGAPATNFAKEDMLAYVGYALNSDANYLSSGAVQLAVAQNLWADAQGVPAIATPPTVRGEALTLADATGADRTTWQPSQAAAQSTPDFSSWSSCSFPQTPSGPAPVRIAQVANTTPPRLQIVGNSDQAVDISGYALVLGDAANPIALSGAQNVDLTAFTAGAQLWVELPTGPCTALNNLCPTSQPFDLSKQEASLKDGNGAIVFHVQWGPQPTAAGGLGGDAQSANVWPLASCRTVAIAQGMALKLIASQSGRGAGDFKVAYPTFF